MFASHNLKEPRRKKKTNQAAKETIFIPLPIPHLNSENKNVELLSSHLPGQYKAILRDKRIYVEDENEAKALFNCGYFGKGEFSRSEPSLNKPITPENNSKCNRDNFELDGECSIDSKRLVSFTEEKYKNRKELERFSKSESTNQPETFHEHFLKEFSKSNTQKSRPNDGNNTFKYCKIPFNDEFTSNKSMYKTFNDPFSMKIRQMPNLQVNEPLNLMHEEAFFLKFGLDCLKIFNYETKIELSILNFWQLLCEIDPEFPFKYAVYHKLRSNGWILKYGLKYGCDFYEAQIFVTQKVVYYEGPDRFHSSYSIRVIAQDMNNFENQCSIQTKKSAAEKNEDFTQFSALVRINETVSKEVMFCYVIYDSSRVDFKTPMCLKEMHCVDVFVNRWVPSENRDPNSKQSDDNNDDCEPNSCSTSRDRNKKPPSNQDLFQFYDSD